MLSFAAPTDVTSVTFHSPPRRTSFMSRYDPRTRRVPAVLCTSESTTTTAFAVPSSIFSRYTDWTSAVASAFSLLMTPSSPPVNASS